MKHLANILTISRMAGAIELLFTPTFSVRFFYAYLFCGLTDMLDGVVARKTGSSSAFGARLDAVADLLFTAAALGRLLPAIKLPGWLWGWTAAIAGVRCGNLLWGFIRWNSLVVEHTRLNKLTGFALFVLPLTMHILRIEYSGAAVCLLASVSAVHEGRIIRAGREIV